MCYPIPKYTVCASTCQVYHLLSVVIRCYLRLSSILCYNLNMSTYKGQTPARRKASEKYRAEKIDTILIRVPKGKKAIIQDAAAKKEKSLNQYIVDSINDALERDM